MIEQKYKRSLYDSFIWCIEGAGGNKEDIEFPDVMSMDATAILVAHFAGKENLQFFQVLDLLVGNKEEVLSEVVLNILLEEHKESSNG